MTRIRLGMIHDARTSAAMSSAPPKLPLTAYWEKTWLKLHLNEVLPKRRNKQCGVFQLVLGIRLAEKGCLLVNEAKIAKDEFSKEELLFLWSLTAKNCSNQLENPRGNKPVHRLMRDS